ncbi:MAG: hypothetical protein E7385_01745 [Ruminococcaceae bacterium]|nr:hypothetical protein [Oscillospiraceae bacterium]
MIKLRLLSKSFYKRIMYDESGMGTIEVIIIIAVLVALALIFRTFIMDLASGIFDKIKDKTDATIDGL